MDSLRQAEEQATAKLSGALPAEKPDGIRPMECAWILAFIYLFVAYLEGSDVSQQVIAEKKIEGCIAQYAAGERYAEKKPQQCAPMVEAPNHILSLPILVSQ